MNVDKPGKKEFLKSYIVLSSCHLTCIGRCMSAQPSKGQCRNLKIFLPLVWVIKVVQNIFFPETSNASTFLSLESRCDQWSNLVFQLNVQNYHPILKGVSLMTSGQRIFSLFIQCYYYSFYLLMISICPCSLSSLKLA